jgi:hypothetical protein
MNDEQVEIWRVAVMIPDFCTETEVNHEKPQLW